jgi:hypothetical protein
MALYPRCAVLRLLDRFLLWDGRKRDPRYLLRDHDKLLPSGRPDGREDKWQENLDPKSCAK